MYKENDTTYINCYELYNELPFGFATMVINFLRGKDPYFGAIMMEALQFCEMIETEFCDCEELYNSVLKMRKHIENSPHIKWVMIE